jgi:hypothetical protein
MRKGKKKPGSLVFLKINFGETEVMSPPLKFTIIKKAAIR